DRRNSAEFLEVRGEHQPAAEFEKSELPVRRIAIVETRQRQRPDRDLGGRGDPARTLRRDRERGDRKSERKPSGSPSRAPKRPPGCRVGSAGCLGDGCSLPTPAPPRTAGGP